MSEVTEAAMRVGNFLKDEAVQTALQAMKQDGYRKFLASTDDAGRAQAQAYAHVVEDFETLLRAVVDAGERETTEQAMRDRAPAARIF